MDISRGTAVKLPRNPGKGTAGVFAHDELARLIEAAKEYRSVSGELWDVSV